MGEGARAGGQEFLTDESMLGRLVQLSSIYGRYESTGRPLTLCAMKHNRAIRATHEKVFAAWLLSPMAAQHADMEIWLHRGCGNLPRWLRVETYRNLVPPSASQPDRTLFICDIEAHLASFRNDYAPEGRNRRKSWVCGLLEFIERDNTKNLKALSRVIGATAETLGEAFYERTGLRFRNYVRIARLLRAVASLGSPQVSVKEAALLAGYSDPSTLARDCRDLIGVKPLELQQRLSALAGITAE